MLLLEPGEIYFEDFSCSMSMSESESVGRRQAGRLKLCSKSLVFEPHSHTAPLIKLQYRDMLHITVIESSDVTCKSHDNFISVKVKQYAEMLVNNILAPYTFCYTEQHFYLTLDFASAEECVAQTQQLLRASTLSPAEHASMIAAISHSRYSRMGFDVALMEDASESPLLELSAERVTPLVRNPGRLALTSTALYFQPFNNIDTSRVLKIRLSELRRVIPRRFLLQQVGVEVYGSGENAGDTVSHLYLVLESETERDELCERLRSSPAAAGLQTLTPHHMTLQWQNRVVSNYDYLLYLNSLADRSSNDLTQYPVMPWVIADYVSDRLDLSDPRVYRDLARPVGALNPQRLAKLKERYDEMCEPKYLYGSHYSAPALVLFYLVRKYPQYMLCLQNGRFDHPDRMFNSVATVYHNCLNNMSDFKELVPEFYDTESGGDFLQNRLEIEFGCRQDGTRVGDVVLPPWANGPEHLIHTLRDALESDYVSARLHLWIDLMFGYKQRGLESVRADNVFHPVCYEGSVELEAVRDAGERLALEVQVLEFGQVPTQLFTRAHVRRLPLSPGSDHSTLTSAQLHHTLQLLDTIRIHREGACAAWAGEEVVSGGRDGVLKVYSRSLARQTRSVALSSVCISRCVLMDPYTVAAACFDNNIYIYNLEFGRLIDTFRAHDDSVTCLLWLQEDGVLISGGGDCMVRVWAEPGRVAHALKGLRAELEHDAPVTTLAAFRRCDETQLAAGTNEGEVCLWRLSHKDVVLQLRWHTSPIAGLSLLSGDRLASVDEAGVLHITDLAVSASVYKTQLEEEVCCCGTDGRTLWLGGRRGTLLQWDVLTTEITTHKHIHNGAINSICWERLGLLLTAGEDSCIKVWSLQAAHR